MKQLLYGRELTLEEVPLELRDSLDDFRQKPAGFQKNGKWLCQRCGQQMIIFKKQICQCTEACGYCTNCLGMGKLKKCSTLYSLPEINQFPPLSQPILSWQGTLSPQQDQASKDIIDSIDKKEKRLLWAVAGAGKTEMLFPGIDHALSQGERVALVSPRVDVCLELYPRLQQAFPSVPISLLYGGMEEEYQYRQVVIATTHQLMRFKEAFDLLIIDEVDAFPFHNDEGLAFASEKAVKKRACILYLSATPDLKMQKHVSKKELKATILPARYHGYPLPTPKGILARDWSNKLLGHPNQSIVFKKIKMLIAKERRFLIFLPKIQWMIRFEEVLRKYFPHLAFESVYSSDPDRKEKVMKMRREEVHFLLTTSILERGVTFPNIDVLVVGAEDRTFTESALVQISGRVGRSAKFPTGEVIYFHDGWTPAMKASIRQIKRMNKLAKERGLLHGKSLSPMQ